MFEKHGSSWAKLWFSVENLSKSCRFMTVLPLPPLYIYINSKYTKSTHHYSNKSLYSYYVCEVYLGGGGGNVTKW